MGFQFLVLTNVATQQNKPIEHTVHMHTERELKGCVIFKKFFRKTELTQAARRLSKESSGIKTKKNPNKKPVQNKYFQVSLKLNILPNTGHSTTVGEQ